MATSIGAGVFLLIMGLGVMAYGGRMFIGKAADLNEMIKNNPDISSSEIEDKDIEKWIQ